MIALIDRIGLAVDDIYSMTNVALFAMFVAIIVLIFIYGYLQRKAQSK